MNYRTIIDKLDTNEWAIPEKFLSEHEEFLQALVDKVEEQCNIDIVSKSLPTKEDVSGISLEQLKLQKECYRERKERNGKATAYRDAYDDEIREIVIDHLIALIELPLTVWL